MTEKEPSLKEQFNELESNYTKQTLTKKVPVIIRLDGGSFCRFTNAMKFDKPYCNVFNNIMNTVAFRLCEKTPHCIYGTRHSDEVSLLMADYSNENTNAFFGYRIQKLVSSLAGLASSVLVKALYEHNINIGEFDPHLDARAFNVPKDLVKGYFILRQRHAEINNISALANTHYSHKRLHCLNSSQKIELLKSDKDIDWTNIPNEQKYGFQFYKEEKDIEGKDGFIKRKKWTYEPIPGFIPDFVDDLVENGS